jgi:hypothetical protein
VLFCGDFHLLFWQWQVHFFQERLFLESSAQISSYCVRLPGTFLLQIASRVSFTNSVYLLLVCLPPYLCAGCRCSIADHASLYSVSSLSSIFSNFCFPFTQSFVPLIPPITGSLDSRSCSPRVFYCRYWYAVIAYLMLLLASYCSTESFLWYQLIITYVLYSLSVLRSNNLAVFMFSWSLPTMYVH